MTISTYEPTAAAEIATVDPTGGRLVSWAKAAQAANQLARALSQTNFVPRDMQDVGNATAAILAGDEVGLSPLAALRSIYVVHGTPAFYARTMVALALAQGHEIWTSESTDQAVTVHGRRRGSDNVETSTWTIKRAQQAGYVSNKKYATNPQEMLYSKASAEIARKIAADVLAGMAYSVEDLELEETSTVKVQRTSGGTSKVSRARKPEPEPEPTSDTPIVDAISRDRDEAAEAAPSQAQVARMFALFGEVLTDVPDARSKEGRAARLAYINAVIGHEVESSKDLTVTETSAVIDSLQADKQAAQTTDADFAAAAGQDDPWEGQQ